MPLEGQARDITSEIARAAGNVEGRMADAAAGGNCPIGACWAHAHEHGSCYRRSDDLENMISNRTRSYEALVVQPILKEYSCVPSEK